MEMSPHDLWMHILVDYLNQYRLCLQGCYHLNFEKCTVFHSGLDCRVGQLDEDHTD